MLTKQELTKKKSADAEQLDLVETISAEDKLHKKRLTLYITLGLTIGLSFVFWAYREIRSLKFEVPKLPSMPVINNTTDTSLSLDPQVSKIIDDDSGWNIALDFGTIYNWQNNREKFDSVSLKKVHDQLAVLKPADSSKIKDYIPQGLTVKEIYSEKDNNLSLRALVVTPQKEILFIIEDSSGNSSQFQSVLSRLVPVLYWSSQTL